MAKYERDLNNNKNMATTREVTLDAVEIRPTMKQVGVRKTVVTSVDDEVVSTNNFTQYYSQGDDMSAEPTEAQDIATYYWSTL